MDSHFLGSIHIFNINILKIICNMVRGDNSCPWVMLCRVDGSCTDYVNIRQLKPDTNNKRVNIR